MPNFPPSGGGGGGVNGVGAQFPLASTGGVTPTIVAGNWLNGAVQYVSGAAQSSDGNDGLGWDTAKATWYEAAKVIIAAHGGTIFLGPGWRAAPTPGSGVDPNVVAGQGMWLTAMTMAIPGYLNANGVKIRTVGLGGPGVADTNQFSGQQIMGYGGSNLAADYRTKPGISMIGGQQLWTFENLGLLPTPGCEGTFTSGLFVPVRNAVDYHRNSNGSIRLMTATSTARAGGQATHVVTMPAGIATTVATRSGTRVTLTIPKPTGCSFPPWNNSMTVWVASTDPNYPSGARQVINCQSTVDTQEQWGFTYDDGTTVVGNPNLSGTISVSSPACFPNSFIEVQTTDFRVPPTQYQVISATPTSASSATIVVTDNWGGFPGIGTGAVPSTLSAGNYGVQIATLEMGFTANGRTILDNAGSPQMSQVTNAIDVYASGPSIHFGGARAFYPQVRNQFLNGYFPRPGQSGNPPYDKYRMASVVVIAGPAAGAGGVRLTECQGSQASVVGLFGEYPSLIEFNGKCTFDTSNGYPPSAVDAIGGTYSVINVTGDLQVADATTGGGMSLTGYFPLNLRGNYNWLTVQSSAGGVTALGNVAEWKVPLSPFKSGWAAPGGPAYGVQFGGTGGASGTKMVGPHPAAWRQISPVTARFQNLVPPVASWASAPLATGIADPLGGTGAVRYDDTLHGSATGTNLCTRTDTFFAAGGHFVMCGWVNVQLGATNTQGLFQFTSSGDLVWETNSISGRSSDFVYVQEFGGSGWLFWYYAPKLISGSASQTYTLTLKSTPHDTVNPGRTADFFGIGAFWCPPTLDDNDVMEFIGTLHAQPYYLLPGMAGTFENQKFIAHGGLGSAKHYVSGVSSGQITVGSANGKYFEVFDESGASLGVFPLSSFTVNP